MTVPVMTKRLLNAVLWRLQERALVCLDPLVPLNIVHALELKSSFTFTCARQIKAPFNPRPPTFTFQRARQCVVRLGVKRQRRRGKP